MRRHQLSRAIPVGVLLAFSIGCTSAYEDPHYGSAEQHQQAAPPDAKAIDLEGIDLSEEGCDCAAAYLKNLQSKLNEEQKLLETAKESAAEAQAFLDDFNSQIMAERQALNTDIASDVALYTGITVDAVALILDVSVPGSALVRRAACVAGKKLANTMVKRALTTVAKRTTIDSPIKSGLRRVGVARVIEAGNNGPLEVMTWIPVIGPATEIYQKWNALEKRDEFIATRTANLVFLASEYDRYVAIQRTILQEVENKKAEVANLESKIASFNAAQAACEYFAGEPEVLEELGIDPNWPRGWSEVFFVKTEPKPVTCQMEWIQFTGSSRLSRFWGERDAVNAARAHSEAMCLNTFAPQSPNPTCEAGYTQYRTAFFDQHDPQRNPGGNRQGAGCGAPRFHGSSTLWSDPLTEIDCMCYRQTCCGQGPTDAAAAVAE
jgi:hypothetical protein